MNAVTKTLVSRRYLNVCGRVRTDANVSVAGAPGLEPGNGGIKIRYLPQPTADNLRKSVDPGPRNRRVLPCSKTAELSKNVIQTALAFDRDWSATVAHSGSPTAP